MVGPHRRPRDLGRPPRIVKVRFSEAELALIKEAAAGPAMGVAVARFVAEAALKEAGQQPSPQKRNVSSRVALAEIAEAAAAISRVGNNLNQLAREYNATGHRPPGAAAAVAEAHEALRHLTDIIRRT